MRSKSNVKPIFYDAGGRRARVVSGVGWIVATVVGALAACLLATTLANPMLPAVDLSSPSRPLLAATDPISAQGLAAIDMSRDRGADATAVAEAGRYAHFVNWDDNSFASLRRNAGALDGVFLEWLHVGQGGSVLHDNPEREAQVRRWHRTQAPDLKLFVLIDNQTPDRTGWDVAGTVKMLAYKPLRANLMRELFRYASAGGHAGVVLDFRELPPQSEADLTAFTREIATLFRRHGMQVMVSLPVEDCRCDYKGLASAADALILRAYDMAAEADAAGPIAGQGWFEERLDTLFGLVGRKKLIVGIGAYAYDRAGPGRMREISVQQAWELSQQSGAALRVERTSLNPGFTYFDKADGSTHTVWVLDGVTAYNQVAAALSMRPAGVAMRRLGAEDLAVWSTFGRNRSADATARAELATVRPAYGVLYRGQGEVHVLDGEETAGGREIAFDAASNLITAERITAFPVSTIVTRMGGAEKKLALTFDDGPDRTYTPQILDILAGRGVKATFFIVGSAGTANSDLMARIYREGHDIGNHTFTHVNSAEVSTGHLRFEINATQRLIEATTGVQTKLFRPPYAENLEPSTADRAEVLRLAASLGYLTVGMSIDPKDWMRPLPRQIVKSTVQAARSGTGSIVLLHDAGGVRTATVQALPEIIDRLRAEGFRFVTVHELLGLRRDEAMPPVLADDSLVASVNHSAFMLFGGTGSLMRLLFELAIALGSMRLLWVASFALIHSRKEDERYDDAWVPPSVAVAIPAYNEEKVICGSIRALLASDLEDFHIIVVDDGSCDRTSEAVRNEFAGTGRVTVHTKANGGKSSALNEALHLSNADILVTLDADTMFEPDALRLIVRHFADPAVGAVAGAAMVGNQINLITRFQALEYVTNQNLDRRALEVVNGITVVPGAIGAWRREALLGIGGFCSDTLAEDADATIRLELAGWRIVYESRAIARTEAPETVSAFLKRRLRWMFGMLQVACKSRAAVLRCKPVGVGLFGLPNILVFQFFFILIAPIIDLMLIAGVVSAMTTSSVATGLSSIAAYWAFFQVLDLATAALAISLDARRDLWRLLPLLLIQRFCYRQLLYATAIRVMIAAVNGRMLAWGKLARTGTVIECDAPYVYGETAAMPERPPASAWHDRAARSGRAASGQSAEQLRRFA